MTSEGRDIACPVYAFTQGTTNIERDHSDSAELMKRAEKIRAVCTVALDMDSCAKARSQMPMRGTGTRAMKLGTLEDAA